MSWLKRLKTGLVKTSVGISEGVKQIFTYRTLDEAMLAELEDVLIQADMGAKVAAKLVNDFGKVRFNKQVDEAEVKEALASEIATILKPVAQPLEIQKSVGPRVILVVGVNGNGKTTTIGKLAARFASEGHKVMLAASDTFRAAAVEQLEVWASRTKTPLVKGRPGEEPASVAYLAYETARKEGMDILMIDTAGRLQNKKGLMEELAKISRVLTKIDETAPHHVVLVLDATTGQNAHSQVEAFKELVSVTGLIVTKLDGTAKAGVVVALAERFGLPIHAVGVGEGVEDLQSFDPSIFAKSLMGIS